MEGRAGGGGEGQGQLFQVGLFIYLKIYFAEVLVQVGFKDKFIQVTFWIWRKGVDYSINDVGITS